MNDASKLPIGRIVGVGFAVLLCVTVLYYLSDGFDLEKVFGTDLPVPPWLFFIAMAVLPVLGFPISVFYLYAGAAYGPMPGIPVCLAALAANMTISYLIATRLFKDPITRWLVKRGYSVPVLSAPNRFRFVFLMRMVPGPPFPVQNYLLALAGVPFPAFLLLSLLLQGIIASGMIWVGDSIWNASSPIAWSAVALGVLVLATLRLWFAFKHSRKEVAKFDHLGHPIETDK